MSVSRNRPAAAAALALASVWLQLALAHGCSSPSDCNQAGRCVDSKCVCAAGFGGAACTELKMSSFNSSVGGLQLANGSTTWGGSVVQADDGSYHMSVGAVWCSANGVRAAATGGLAPPRLWAHLRLPCSPQRS